MTTEHITYLVFGLALTLAVLLDLSVLSKSSVEISIKKALLQTLFWVSLAFLFWGYLWINEGHETAVEYISAYLMEWSLSVDNIFVFILIFTVFNIKTDHVARALLIGILMAIVLRIGFITLGVALVNRFYWLLYFFGAFLVYTGVKMFVIKNEKQPVQFDNNVVLRFLNRFFPIIHEDVSGKFIVKRNGKRFLTNLFIVIILLATTDLVFALDSIPAVLAISQNKLVIYTSNIFAVLGLRSLFFLLKGAVNRFGYLQQGIAIILIFIGIKMLLELIEVKIKDYISLIIIVICLAGSIGYSVQISNKRN